MICVPSLPPRRKFKSYHRLLIIPAKLCMTEVNDWKCKKTTYKHSLSVGVQDF